MPINKLCTVILLSLFFLSAPTFTQTIPPGVGEGWLPEFNHAASQINALAEATPADKFSWRPAPGVRSVSEVYMHIVFDNYFFLTQTGVKLPADVKITQGMEKKVTTKADVLKWLKSSQDLIRENYPKADLQKKVKFLGKDTTVDAVYLRCLIHNNEHMGQSIAYARMVGIVPPWSQ